jgi:transposase
MRMMLNSKKSKMVSFRAEESLLESLDRARVLLQEEQGVRYTNSQLLRLLLVLGLDSMQREMV